MLVLSAKIASPIGMAIRPLSYGVRLPRPARYGVLTALAGVTIKDSENAIISVPTYFHVVAVSAQTGNSLQGSFNGGASGSIAILSASVGAGIQYNRKVAFNNFDTLVLPAPVDEGMRTISVTVKEIRSDVKSLFNRAKVGAQANTIDKKIVVAMNISAALCGLNWELANRNADGSLDTGDFGEIDPSYDDDKCNFTLLTNKAGQDAYTANSLTIHNPDLDLQNTLQSTTP